MQIRVIRSRFDRKRGQALVEGALVIGLIVTVMLGIIDFGFVFFSLHMVTNAARDGARVAAVLQNRGGCGGISSTTSVRPLITNEVQNIVTVEGTCGGACGGGGWNNGVCVEQCVAHADGSQDCASPPANPPCPTFTTTDLPVVKVTVSGKITDIFKLVGASFQFPYCRSATFRDEGR